MSQAIEKHGTGASASVVDGRVVYTPINALSTDPDQPRKTFSQEGLQVLAASIAKSGILVPLLARRGEGDALIIHDGERRYRAAIMAKLESVPVIVTDAGENTQLEQFAMNNLREQLKPMEVARMLAELQRKQFASTNDLAAHLDRSGLPAMSPKQIEETIALVDLPDWLQNMIDADQVEVSGAVQVRKIEHLAGVLEWVKEAIEEDVAMGGKATDRDVSYDIDTAVRNLGTDLSIEPWRSNPPHFNPKKICKGCEFKVTAGHTSYCLNQAEFDRKNAEAKAAGLLPGGMKPQKPTAAPVDEQQEQAEAKSLSRADTLQRKAQEYLHAYLVQRIVAFMQDGDSETMEPLINITDELLAWHAMGRPGGMSHQPGYGPKAYDASKVLGVRSLEDLFSSLEMESVRLNAALEIAHTLPWRETQVICHEMWGLAIEDVWRMDDAFLKLFRKAELLQLVADHNLVLEPDCAWNRLKLADLRTEILARANQVIRPKLLQDTYVDLAEPWVPYSERSWSEDPDDEGFDGGDDDIEEAA